MTRAEILALDGRELRIKMAEFVGYNQRLVIRFRYSDLARLALEEIDRRGKIRPFCDALWDMRNMDAALSVVDEMWATITATPKQICHAALLAAEGV